MSLSPIYKELFPCILHDYLWPNLIMFVLAMNFFFLGVRWYQFWMVWKHQYLIPIINLKSVNKFTRPLSVSFEWRYFSFSFYHLFSWFSYDNCAGMDAQVSYAFHRERKLHPEKFKNQLVNQVLHCPLLFQEWFKFHNDN